MVLTEPDVRDARPTARPPMGVWDGGPPRSPTPGDRRPRPPSHPLRKRARAAASLSLWLLTVAGQAVTRGLRQAEESAALATARAVRPRTQPARPLVVAPPRPRPRRPPRPRQGRPPVRVAGGPPQTAQPRGGARFVTHLVALVLLGLVVLPNASTVGLRLVAPMATSLASQPWKSLELPSAVVAADGSPLALLHEGINRRIVTLPEIPDFVRNAVITAEDKRFWSHRGYDGEAVGRAFVANVQAREVTQGGSTITQQLAKQNFVGDEPTVLRKGKELLYAVVLEQRFTKEQLLERYLNQVYFGSGAYGVAAAAQEFFGTDVGQLSVEQGALLASLIRAPSALDPRSNPDAAIARRNEVLRAMASAGYLSGPAAAAATAAPLGVVPSRPPENPEPFVVEAVKREFLANPTFGPTEEDRRRLLHTGGLRIQTTVDPALQEAARAATRWVPESLGSAVVAVDPRSGGIVALHDGGTAAVGHFDVATQGTRQPGSTFKPLVAAAALEAGMPEWQQLVGDGPIELDYPGAPESWRVDNFNGSDHGWVGLREAVTDSVNTAFAQLGVALGPDRIARMAQRLGIDVERDLGPPASRGPSMALGGLTHGVSPLELASAYATFAAGGWRAAPHVIEQVMGPEGQEIYRAQPATQVVLDRAVNGALVDILRDAVTSGTGSAAALPGWEVLGKTGTSEGAADAWFVGAVPVLSTAVWVGRPDSEEPIPGVTGGAVSAPIWRTFMAAALAGEKPVKFDTPTTKRASGAALPLPKVRKVSEPAR